MPYEKMSDVPPQFKSLAPAPGGQNKVELTLAQANEIARMADGLKGTEGIDSPWAIAIANFRRMYACEGGKWIKKKKKMEELEELSEGKEIEEDEIDKFASREEGKEKQEVRAEQYKIGIKPDGNIAKPFSYTNVPDSEFADPVNFRYPLNRDRVLPAIQYFNQEDQGVSSDYSTQEWAIIGNRIARIASKILDVDYKYKGGKIVRSEEELGDDKADDILGFGETYDIKGLPFFKVGKYNGAEYKEDDLDKMMGNFTQLKESVKPVLKLGHGSQKFLKDEGMPAAGWVTNIRKKGKILYADIVNIPKRIYELIKNKTYRRPSAEIYLDFKDDEGRKHGLTLSAIALLGADIPAVKSLPDIETMFNGEMYTATINCYNENYDRNKEDLIMAEFTDEQAKEELEKVQQELDTLKTEKEDLEKENTDLKIKADKVDQLEEEAGQIEETKKIEDVSSTLKKYKETGQILPVQEAALSALLLSLSEDKVVTYSENEKSEDLSQPDLVFKVLDLLPNVVEFSELSEKREQEKKGDSEAQYRKMFTETKEKDLELDGVEVAELAEKISQEQKVSYTDALVEASRQLEKE